MSRISKITKGCEIHNNLYKYGKPIKYRYMVQWSDTLCDKDVEMYEIYTNTAHLMDQVIDTCCGPNVCTDWDKIRIYDANTCVLIGISIVPL